MTRDRIFQTVTARVLESPSPLKRELSANGEPSQRSRQQVGEGETDHQARFLQIENHESLD